jgi:lipopolysaccharide export system protein LptA
MYVVYAALVSPLVAPGPELVAERNAAAATSTPRLSENARQARDFLRSAPWAHDAKFQVRTKQAFVFAQEWEKIKQTGRVRFKPFAMIWRSDDQDPKKAPITIVCDSALVEFSEKFEGSSTRLGRVVGGALEGPVTIAGADGLALDGRDINFSEAALRMWSDYPVAFRYGPHSGHGQGLELDLIAAPGLPGDDKPAVSGVRTLRLLKDVVMDLVSRPRGDGKPGETVHVTSAGSFEYGVESSVAVFQKEVRVVRPTEGNQTDRLNCELLTLIFEPKKPEDDPAVPPEQRAAASTAEPEFRRLRAEGPNTTIVSQRSQVQARMEELAYDAQSRVVTLRDPKNVRMVQRNNELICPEITAILDEEGQVEQSVCRGSGKLFSFARDARSASVPRRNRKVELAGEWLKELNVRPDPQSGLTLIELTGRAVLSQAGKMALQADIVRLWVASETTNPSDDHAPRVIPKGDTENSRPRRMLALGSAVFASPQMTGETDRLEVWFDEGPLPPAPTARHLPEGAQSHRVFKPGASRGERARETRQAIAPPVAESRRPRAGRLGGRAGTTGFAAVPSARNEETPSPSEVSSPPPRATGPVAQKGTETPMHVTAGLIQVRSMTDGDRTDVAEVITEERVHVTQERNEGEPPFDLAGDRLHLWNYSEMHQVIRVEGQPAHIRDRGLQLEGADIHFDREANEARVEGPGVLRLPVKNGFDGKPLTTPQLLDVFWNERMEFDGETARFFARVRTQLEQNEMRCEEMHVTLSRRISFSKEEREPAETEIRHVVCRDGVELKSREYLENRLVQIRTARGFEFALDQSTGQITAQGPGTLALWRRSGANRTSLATSTGVRANRPLQTETSEWDYTRVDFAGQMQGNTREQATEFVNRVRVVYGPVARSTDTIDADELPKGGGRIHCERLELSQHAAVGPQKGSIAIVGRGNAELEGRTEHGLFNAKAARVSYDESKGLFSLFGDGKRDATIWREGKIGTPPGSVGAQRMEFNPARDELKVDRASGAQGGQ